MPPKRLRFEEIRSGWLQIPKSVTRQQMAGEFIKQNPILSQIFHGLVAGAFSVSVFGPFYS